MFENQVAVITGSARGIGRAIAESLAEKKCNIIITDILKEEGEKTAASIQNQFGVKAHFIECDVTKSDDCKALAKKTVEELGFARYLGKQRRHYTR